MTRVNTKQVSFLMQLAEGYSGTTVEVFINHFGNFGVAYNDVSIYIEHGEYHVSIGQKYYNGLNEQEVIDLFNAL